MEPKGFLGTWCTIFALTGLPFGVLMSTIGGAQTSGGMIAGVAFGLLFGLSMAPLMMGVRAQVPIADRQSFLGNLNLNMAELAYQPKTQQPEFVIYEAVTAGAYKLGTLSLTPASFFTVFVQLDADSAAIVGPRQTVRKLEKRLLKSTANSAQAA